MVQMIDNKARSGMRRSILPGYPLLDRIGFTRYWRVFVAFLRKFLPADATNTQRILGILRRCRAWRRLRRMLCNLGLVTAPIHYCDLCGELLHGRSVGEHCDTCPEFKKRIRVVLKEHGIEDTDDIRHNA